MESIFDNAALFLVQAIFGLYILIVILRVVLQWVGARFHNPISQIILKLTNPVVTPIRKILPPIRGIDVASLFLLVLLEFIKAFLMIFLKAGFFASFLGLIIFAFSDILDILLDIFFFAIIIQAILSWVNPMPNNPINEILYLITEPLLRPARRLIPNLGGIDISPIPVLLLLQLISIIITQPLMNIGLSMAIS